MLKKNENGNDNTVATIAIRNEETTYASATFTAYAASTATVSRTTASQDGFSCTTYDISLAFLDQVPLDGDHGKSCLVRLSKPEVQTLITMLTNLIS